jgi:ABC-2 type transport system permease protein
MAAFCAIGLFIGSLVSGSAALGIVNLIYFPMMYLSGTFFPLPDTLAPWAMIWPAFYLDQIFFAITLGESAVGVDLCVAVLTGLTLLFAGLATHRLVRANGAH